MMLALIIQGALLLGGQTPDQNAEVEKLFAEGASLYKAGKYRPAIDKFEAAYALFPEPNLLYNMARAHEALGDIDQAIVKFTLCTTNPRSTDELKQKAAAKLAVLTAARAQGAAAPTPTPTPTPPPAAAGNAGPATTATPPPAAATTSSTGLPMLGIAGGVTTGLGVVGAAIGGVLYGLGATTHGDLESSLSTPDANGVVGVTRADAEAQSLAGTNQKTMGVALLGVGGALVVGGGVLLTMQLLGGE
jgi:tetratricopeptide (TPR) repeat protein